MQGFAADYLANLAAGLTASMLESAGRRAREGLAGSEQEQALRRCVQLAITATLATASTATPEETDLLEDIWGTFFREPDVGRELAMILRGGTVDVDELAYLFAQCGYDAASLPGPGFTGSVQVFEPAFLAAAAEEPALQGIIQTNQLLEQTRLLREQLATIRELAAAMRDAQVGRVGIRAGQITATNVVNGTQVIYEWSGGGLPLPDEEVAPLRRAYLNHLYETVGRLSLAGVDPQAASDAEARLDLSAVYTALLTLALDEGEGRAEKRHQEELPGPAGQEPRRLSAIAQLDRHPRLVLLGDPGSGKSTFVDFVALCLAGEALGQPEANLARLAEPLPRDEERRREEKEPEPQPWSHGALLPVRIALRDLAARGLPPVGEKAAARHLCEFVAAELDAAALGDYRPHLERELRAQGGLLLLDGLDEVPEANQRREQIKDAVVDFAAAFPRCRILVTSRTYAYQQQAWRLPDFMDAVLAPFGAGQIGRFVDRWYAHIAALRGMYPEEAGGRAVRLKGAIRGSGRLRELAERPLLLTLMASLHAWRGGSLSERREELYADAVELLLDWWESAKEVPGADGVTSIQQPSLAEWLKVDRRRVRELLDELAYRAHAQQHDLVGTADVPEDDLLSGLMRISQNPDVRPARLVEYLSRRAGLLLPRGVGVYTFPHRTFQEYLAACYLTDHDYPEQVAELARLAPERWREVALLAGAKAARGTASAVWSLADALCFRNLGPGQEQIPADAWGALLAGQALVESANPGQVSERNQGKVGRVRAHLVRVLETGELPAVDRAAAGDALARLGDPRSGVGLRPDGLPGIAWCGVPVGPFVMGSDDADELAWEDEKPQHEVTLPAFRIARYPVTNAQYGAFVRDGGYTEQWRHCWTRAGWRWKEDRTGPDTYGGVYDLPNHPVVMVRWYEAVAFCRWLTARLRQAGELGPDERVALPSEAQWEKAARGTDRRIYPWGDDPDPDRANYADTGISATSAVGCFPGGASPYGVQDMSGNVWELCATKWEDDYKGYQGDNDVEGDARRVVRGGSFLLPAHFIRCTYRFKYGPVRWNRYVGFRVCVAPGLPSGQEE